MESATGANAYTVLDRKIAAERTNNRLWRAKELVRGRMTASNYDRELFRRYAEILADMHDDDEAGRYYFLSGYRSGRAVDLVKTFLHRRAKREFENFWNEMPQAAHRISPNSIPDICRSELAELGHTNKSIDDKFKLLQKRETSRQKYTEQHSPGTPNASWLSAWVRTMLVGSLIASVILILGLGTVEFAKAIWNLASAAFGGLT
jgi:hypothetical protein